MMSFVTLQIFIRMVKLTNVLICKWKYPHGSHSANASCLQVYVVCTCQIVSDLMWPLGRYGTTEYPAVSKMNFSQQGPT